LLQYWTGRSDVIVTILDRQIISLLKYWTGKTDVIVKILDRQIRCHCYNTGQADQMSLLKYWTGRSNVIVKTP
jgi:phenylacetate-coenzyme A ligase PaaK-like adenylate-forming protein